MNSVIQKVREKYPQYGSLSDDDLTSKIGEKYPQYLQVEDFRSDFERVKRISGEQAQLKSEMTLARQEGEQAGTRANVLELAESAVKGALSMPFLSPKAAVETVEGGIEGIAKLTGLAGPNDELIDRPSRYMVNPLVPIAQVPKQDGTVAQIAAGTANAVIEFANFMQTPDGIAFLGIGGLPAAARKAATVAIAGQMAAHAPEQFNAAVEEARQGNVQEAAKQAATFVGTSAMSALAGRHSISTPEVKVMDSAEAMKLRPDADQIAREVMDPKNAQEYMPAGLNPGEPGRVAGQPEPLPAERGAQYAIDTVTPETMAMAERIQLNQQREAEVQESKLESRDPAFRQTAEQKINQRSIGEGEQRSSLGPLPDLAVAQRLADSEAKVREQAIQQAVEQLETSNAPITAEAVKRVAGVVEAKPVVEVKPVVEPAEPARSTQSLGITPEGSEFLNRVIDYLKPRDPGAQQEVVVDRSHVLPRFQPYEQERALASRPQGIARLPILARFIDPRYGAKEPVDQAIITRAYSLNKGQTFGAIWAQVHQPTKKAWDMKDLEETGSFRLTDGERGYLSDVIEAEIRNPGSQKITAEQRAWVNDTWLPVLRDINAMLKSEGVRRVVLEDGSEFVPGEDYFPRPPIGRRNRSDMSTGGGRATPGAKQFFQKSRKYKTEQEGATGKQEIIYDPDPISRVSKLISGAYRAIADHRLANDMDMGGTSIQVRLSALKRQHKAELDLLDGEARRHAEIDLAERAGGTSWGDTTKLLIAPAFTGKVYPVDVAAKLTRAYGENHPHIIRKLAEITGIAKAFKLTMDVSAPFTQGIALFFRRPDIWAEATAEHYRALLDRDTMAKFMQAPENQKAAVEFAQSGGTVFRLQDFLQGMDKGEPGVRGFKTLGRAVEATGVPGLSKATGRAIGSVGSTIEATGRAYGAFLDVAKLEMWKAFTKSKQGERVDAKEWSEVAEAIENSLFIGRMEQVGLNPGRSVVERMIALAPSYYRGSVGLITTAFLGGKSGKLAMEMMGAYASGITMVTIASYLGLRMSWDEIKRRLDPRSGKFMKIPVPAGDGNNVEVGFGNILSSYVRMVGKGYTYFTSDNPIKTGVDNNPFLGYLRGKAALLPSVLIDIVKGRDFSGEPQGAFEAIIKQFQPLVISQLTEDGPATPGQRIEDAAFSFLGLQSFPENKRGLFIRAREDMAKKTYKLPYSGLTFDQKAKVTKEMLNDERFKREVPNQTQIEQAFARKLERQNRLAKLIKPENRKKIEDLGLKISGYDPSLSINGTRVPLTEKEIEVYEGLVVTEYDKAISNLDIERVTRKKYGERQDYVNDKLTDAKKKAQSKLKKLKP